MKSKDKKILNEYVRIKLRTNYKWQCRALTRLFDDQTINERIDAISSHKNSKGFNSADAFILSKLAMFYNKNSFLTKNQQLILTKKLPKYSKQVIGYIDEVKQQKILGMFSNVKVTI